MTCALRGVLTTLAQVNDWCDLLAAGRDAGIAVDSYAVWWDPELATEMTRAGPRLLHLHIADWLSDTRDVRVCVQQRLARSAGDRPAGVRARAP